MKEYVLGVDLGTSAVKVSAVDRTGHIAAQESYDYPLSQPQPGYSEQNPDEWVNGTAVAIVRLVLNHHIRPEEIPVCVPENGHMELLSGGEDPL